MANHTDSKWHGIEIKRGQHLTSLNSLYYELNYSRKSKKLNRVGQKFSVQRIRTALDRLKSTHEITINATRDYSLITVNNYDCYQGSNKQINTLATHEPHTSHTLATLNKNDKNDKNEKNDKKGSTHISEKDL